MQHTSARMYVYAMANTSWCWLVVKSGPHTPPSSYTMDTPTPYHELTSPPSSSSAQPRPHDDLAILPSVVLSSSLSGSSPIALTNVVDDSKMSPSQQPTSALLSHQHLHQHQHQHQQVELKINGLFPSINQSQSCLLFAILHVHTNINDDVDDYDYERLQSLIMGRSSH
jgi:hypothetical protein